jgi:fatty acid desaturase
MKDHRGASAIRALVPRERLRALGQRRDAPALLFLCAHLLALAASGYLLHRALGTWWAVPAIILHGVVIVHLFAPFHETTHGTAFRTRWLNQIVAWLSGLALFLPPTHFTLEHAAHHKFTQDPELDPERIPQTDTVPGYLLYVTSIPYFRYALVNLVNHARGRFSDVERSFVPPKSLPKLQREAWLMWLAYAALAAISLATQSWAVVLYWLLPRIAGEPVMRIIRVSEHGACPLVPDMLRNTRTVITWRPLRWLNWNNAHHAEHHALPGIPFHALPELHQDMRAHLEELRPGYVATQAHLLRQASSHSDVQPFR